MSRGKRLFCLIAGLIYAVAKFASGLFNLVILDGDWHQSTSSRVHVEAHDQDNPRRRQWQKWERRIDAAFLLWERPWGKLFGTKWGDHCRRATDAHEARAIHTLALIRRVGHSHEE